MIQKFSFSKSHDHMCQTPLSQIWCFSIKWAWQKKIHAESGQMWFLGIFHWKSGFCDEIGWHRSFFNFSRARMFPLVTSHNQAKFIKSNQAVSVLKPQKSLSYYMGQSIQEWTKYNLWKTTFKKIEAICSASADHITSNFLKAFFHKFYLVHS